MKPKILTAFITINFILWTMCLCLAHESVALLKNTSEELRALSAEHATMKREIHIVCHDKETLEALEQLDREKRVLQVTVQADNLQRHLSTTAQSIDSR